MLKVVNVPPETVNEAPPELLKIFRKYFNDESTNPFTHQVEAWEKVLKGESLYLVADAIAGKSLAALAPLMYKLNKGISRKIVFMYPLRTSLEEQLKIIHRLASMLNLEGEVGVLKGEQSRTEIISTLAKKIIAATPDEFYWLFRRRTKYNSLMMYSLSHVDDFLLDEAHILSGLALENIRLFMENLNTIRQKYLNKPPFKLHILTTTPTANISKMLQSEDKVVGSSKAGAVSITVEELMDKGSLEFWQEQINKHSASNFRRLIVVLDTAKKAHKLFYKTYLLRTNIPGKIGWISGKTFVNSFLELKTNHPEIKLKDFIELPKVSVKDLEDRQYPFTWDIDKWHEVLETIEIEEVHTSFIEDNFESPTTIDEWNIAWNTLRNRLALKTYKNLLNIWSSYLLTVDEGFFYKYPEMIENQSISLCLKKVVEMGLGSYKDTLLEKWQGNISHPYARQWPHTSIPVFLYTGGISHRDREGLAEAFNSPEINKAILITTSVVESGVDFDADLLITDCADVTNIDANNIIQRFGRIGRHSNAKSVSRMVLYVGKSEYIRLREVLRQLKEMDKPEVNRKELHTILKKSLGETKRIDKSLYLDALHSEITGRVGIVGIEITDQHEFTKNVMSTANLNWSYNLKGAEVLVEFTKIGIKRGVFSTLPLIRGGDELELVDNSFVQAKAFITVEQLVKREWMYVVDVDLSSLTFFDVAAAIHKGEYWEVASSKEAGKYAAEPAILCYGHLLLDEFSIEDKYRDERGPHLDKKGRKILLPEQWFILIGRHNLPEEAALKRDRLLQMAESYSKDITKRIGQRFILLTEQELGACVELYYQMATL